MTPAWAQRQAELVNDLSLSRFLSGMMRLRPHDTVTGGTTHGWFTVYRATVSPDGVPGFHQPDPRRVSAAGPALRGRVPRPDGGVANGWETADGSPVYRLQKLSSPDPRKIGFCSSWSTSKPMPSRWCTGAYSGWFREKPTSGFMSSSLCCWRHSVPLAMPPPAP
jgi:hypothetical protein